MWYDTNQYESFVMPDPVKDASEEAQRINANRHYYLETGIERIIADAPHIEKQQLIKQVENFYKEAMAKIPSFVKYPEARTWVDYVITRDRKLMELAHLTIQEIAVLRSTNDYLTFRGYKEFGLKRTSCDEKCRVAFIPDTDMGPMHIKNVDDPITWWSPSKRLDEKAPVSLAFWYHRNFVIDGVGSGLHIDDEPEEIFPLPVLKMVDMYAWDTDSAVEFLKKYSVFWGGCNVLIYDKKYKSVAIEKCSRNFCEVFEPEEPSYFTHISGMVCRDKSSPQAKYQKEKRNLYRNLFNLADDGPDALFWKACDHLEHILSQGIKKLGKNPLSKDVITLFITPYPAGLRKDGLKLHPQQGLIGYTLITNCIFPAKKLYYRWQRSSEKDKGIWPEQPEICQYE
ncbi:MAG TPA: hypothetical protein PKW86_00820 [bacterium]|nr:hypothetical protein [bacterium]